MSRCNLCESHTEMLSKIGDALQQFDYPHHEPCSSGDCQYDSSAFDDLVVNGLSFWRAGVRLGLWK